MNPEQPLKTSGWAIASMICGIIALIPVIGLLTCLPAIIMGVAALIKISGNKTQFKGNGLAISGIVMGGIGVVTIPFILLLAAIVGPNILSAHIKTNDTRAVATLKALSVATHTFATAHNGRYPESVRDLMEADIPYISTNYCEGEHNGFTFECAFDAQKYRITARPVELGITGSQTFRMDASGAITYDPLDSPAVNAEHTEEISFESF